MPIDPQSPTMLKANTAVVGSMLVAEEREILAARKRAVKRFEQAALARIKATEGRDLVAEQPNWTSFRVECDHRPTGTVVVKQFAHGEHPPSIDLRQTWRVAKRDLVASRDR